MKRHWHLVLPSSVLVGLGLYVAMGGGLLEFRSGGQDAQAADQRFAADEVVTLAQPWAGTYVSDTLGTQISVDGRPLRLSDMANVDLRLVEDATEAMKSVDSGVRFGQPRDFWVVAWERGSVHNSATGLNDGTAYIIVVMEDITGKVLSADAGVRQPEEQARARDPLPSVEERFGEFLSEVDQSTVVPPPAP